jgi:hypothetical protein
MFTSGISTPLTVTSFLREFLGLQLVQQLIKRIRIDAGLETKRVRLDAERSCPLSPADLGKAGAQGIIYDLLQRKLRFRHDITNLLCYVERKRE